MEQPKVMHLDVWLPYHFFVGVFSIEIIRALIKNQQVLVKTIPQTLVHLNQHLSPFQSPKVKERTIMYQGEDGWDQQPLMLGLMYWWTTLKWHWTASLLFGLLSVMSDFLGAFFCSRCSQFIQVMIFATLFSSCTYFNFFSVKFLSYKCRFCVVFLTFSCIGYAMPFILCATICCCLPCIISILGFREDLGQIQGASSELINAFPTYKFKLKRHGSREYGEINSDSSGKGGILAVGTDIERVISGEDAVCCICLANYGDNEELRELPCAHYFHVACVDKWLKINASCPICKDEVCEPTSRTN